jgi:uncharacterized protein YjiK
MTWLISGLLAVPVVCATSAAAASSAPPVQPAREVRTTWTGEFGVARPSSVTYVPSAGELLVGESTTAATDVVRLDFDEQSKGSLELPPLSDASTLSYDAKANELTGVNDGDLVVANGSDLQSNRPAVRRTGIQELRLQDPEGSTFDPATGIWYVLDAGSKNILRVANRLGTTRTVTRISVTALTDAQLRGLAFNPNDGLLYVGSPDEHRVYAVATNGTPRKAYDLSELGLRNPAGMTFAPSADTTDAPARQNLFVAQTGDTQNLGGVTEVTLAAAPAVTVSTINATLVRTIDTSVFNPGSPDPSGIAYLSPTDRMHIVDSEVEETTGAGYHGVNMWQFTRSGTQTATGTTFPRYSKEPTGVAYDPGSNTMFISDDSARRIHIVKPGADGRFGNADDVITFIDAKAVGSGDTEDPAFDPVSRNLFFADAVSTEVYRVNPVNGVFGDGNDVITHFDVGALGPTDNEGLAYNAANDSLLVGDRTTRKIYEITKTGTLLRIINAKVGNYTVLSGLTVAPASDNSGRQDFWIASRGVDNGPQPNENDGKVVEVSIGSAPVDTPPSVSVTNPAEGATVSGANVSVQASASDDKGVTQVQFFDGSTSLGTDTNGADGWSVTWNTTAVADGAHVLKATATDTIGQTASDTNNVTVDNTPGTTQVLDIPVAAGNDDVEERTSDGAVQQASTDLDMLLDNTVPQTAIGLRFTGISIPRGAVITNAYVQFKADETWSDPTSLTINALAADNTNTFPTAKFSLSQAARTAASTAWNPIGWIAGAQGVDQRTPSIAAVVQEIVNRQGWASGNAMSLVITGSGRRVAKSFEGAAPPILHIEYTT